MKFGQRLREYRKHHLNIKVNEAAYRIGINPTAYSNYEQGTRSIPLDLLPTIKEAFAIPDTLFLDMLLGVEQTLQKSSNDLIAEIQEIRERYNAHFSMQYYDLIAETPDIRELISMLAMLDTKKRHFALHAIRGIVQVNVDLLKKIEQLEGQNSDS